MWYQPSLLGLSFLVLTCAFPTLGSTSLDSQPTSALIPKPLLRIHRHYYHRQNHHPNTAIGLSRAADGNSQAKLTIGTLGYLPSATDTSLSSPSNGPAILPSTGTTVLASAVPTQGVLATSGDEGSVTTDGSQAAGSVDTDTDADTDDDDDVNDDDDRINDNDVDGRNSNANPEPDPGMELEDQTDPNTTTTALPTAEESSTPTAALDASDVETAPPVESSVSFSVDSFVSSTFLSPLVIVPAGIPSSRSQFLTTNPVAFPTVTPARLPVPVAPLASPSLLSSSPRTSSATFFAPPTHGPLVPDSTSSVSGLLPTGGPSVASNHGPGPNPASSSPQAERSKKAAVLAGFLILGTLGAIAVALLCSYCGLFRCCRRHKDRGFASTERTAEEGLGGDDPPKLVRVNLDEKWSIIPGSPPPADVEDFVQTLPRDAHAHTLSCSTCPPDSLNGVRGGVPGGVNRAAGQLAQGWVFPEHGQFANASVVPQHQGEDAMARIAPYLGFTIVHPEAPGPATQSAPTPVPVLAEVQASAPSGGPEAVSGTSPPYESAIGETVSSSGDSYMTCDSASKYSMASGRRASESGAESIVEENGNANAETDTERPSTPEASHSSSTTGSPSILMTPEQPGAGYGVVGVMDAALQTSPTPAGGLAVARSGEIGGGVGSREESEWDVVAAYSYGVRAESKEIPVGEMVLRSRPVTQGQKAVRKKNVRERRATGVGIVGKGSKVVGPVALGERHVMVVQGV